MLLKFPYCSRIISKVAYNLSINATTAFSPYYFSYRIHTRAVVLDKLTSENPAATNFLRNMQGSLQKAQEQIKRPNEFMASYIKRRRRPSTSKVGYKVWLSTKILALKNSARSWKLNQKFCGQLEISEDINVVKHRLNISQPMIDRRFHNAFHPRLLQLYFEDSFYRQTTPPPPVQDQDGQKNTKSNPFSVARKGQTKIR